MVAGTDVVAVEGARVNVCGDDPPGSITVVTGPGDVPEVGLVEVVVSPGEVDSVGLVGVVVVVVLSDSPVRTLVRGTQVYCGSGMKPGGTTAISGMRSGAGGS